MALAGEIIVAGKIPGERIATTVRTVSSATITTTETVVDTVTAFLVLGRTYRVVWTGENTSSVAGDDLTDRIRDTDLAGAQLQGTIRGSVEPNRNDRHFLDFEYTADATGNKTFVYTLVRQAGTGTITSPAAASAPTYFTVDYLYGP